MCGIAASFSYDARAVNVDRNSFRRTCDRMECRGPDAQATWISADERIALGHRRLSIIDLSERGAQPMRSVDGRYVITFNGEIYNYRALRAELEETGCHFRSHSDTEVLLHLYAQRGEAMVLDLRGMFAFAVWDEVRHGLFVARDAFGIKPLYYADDGRTVRLASEVKALLRGGGIDTSAEPVGHVGFFVWGYVPEPYTLYRGIRAFPAGSTAWIDASGMSVPRPVISITELLAEAAQSRVVISPVERRERIRGALLDSVRHHMVSDVPVGVFLSAGLDSSTLTGLASEVGGRVRTITLGFDEYAGSGNDEVPLAETVARHYGADHRTVRITQRDFDRELPFILDRMDQPTIDGVNSYFVAQAAAQSGLKVALSGLGGDELFGGYPSFDHVPRLVSLVGRVPGHRTVGRGLRLISAPLLRHFTSPKYASLFEYGADYAGAYLLKRGLFLPWELPSFLNWDLVRDGWRGLEALMQTSMDVSTIDSDRLKISALESVQYMRNQLLRDTDWASMSHSLEVRVPLVDVVLWRELTPLLASTDVFGKRGSLASASRPALPAAVVQRSKTGFAVPTRDWLTDPEPSNGKHHGARAWARRVYREFL